MPVIKKSINLNYQQLIRWREQPSMNPKTGKSIKIDGPTYNEIQKRYDKYMEKYTEEECRQWIDDRTINPKTSKKIKEGKVVYERIRNSCEQLAPEPSIKLVSQKEKEYIEDVEEELIQDINSIPIYMRLFKSCKSCAVNLSNNLITSLGCVDKKCMVKGCPWDGRYGINLSRIPMVIKNFMLSIIIKIINADRCCCVCFGHLLLILNIVLFQLSQNRIDSLTRESIKIQKTINSLESSTDISKTISRHIANEANKQIDNWVWKRITNPVTSINSIIKYVYEDTHTNKSKFLSSMEELTEIIR